MAIKYLAGERLIGTAAERAALGSSIDFTASSSGQTWTQTGASTVISGTTITATNNPDNGNPAHRITAPLGITLSDDDWIMDFDFSQSGTANNMFPILVSNSADKIIANSMDWVALGGEGTTGMRLTIANAGSGNSGSSTSNITVVSGTTYYGRIIRNDDSFNLKIYSTAALRSAAGTGDTGDVTQSTPTGITGLTYMQSSGRSDGGGGNNSWVVNNVNIYNGIASITYPSLSNGAIFEESDTGKWYMFDGSQTWNEMT